MATAIIINEDISIIILIINANECETCDISYNFLPSRSNVSFSATGDGLIFVVLFTKIDEFHV